MQEFKIKEHFNQYQGSFIDVNTLLGIENTTL